jgi:hypothetical protein
MREQQDLIEADKKAYVRAVHDRGLSFDLATMSRHADRGST